MKEEKANTNPAIELDLSELLGFSQMAKVSGDPDALGRLLNKVGVGENTVEAPLLSRLLSKIGGTENTVQSDIRLKTDIRHVGTTAHNLPLYAFRYIGNDDQYEGVMAQDVLKVMPIAVTVGEDGYYRVNYDMLGIEMRRLD